MGIKITSIFILLFSFFISKAQTITWYGDSYFSVELNNSESVLYNGSGTSQSNILTDRYLIVSLV